MTGFTFVSFSDEPITLLTFSESWSTHEDSQKALEVVKEAFEASDVPVFYIVDMLIEPKFNFQDFLALTSELTRGGNPLLRHPKMREHLIVTANAMVKMATKGLGSETFGGVKARSFDTLDEALAYARSAA